MVASLKLLLADFDGCAVGVMSGPGLPALKPWRVATSRPRVAAALSTLRCPGDHEHGHLSGSWATKSGHYTPHFCQIVLEAVAEDLADSAGLWPTSRVLHLTDPKPRRHGRGKGHLERRARRYSLATLLGMRRRAPPESAPGVPVPGPSLPRLARRGEIAALSGSANSLLVCGRGATVPLTLTTFTTSYPTTTFHDHDYDHHDPQQIIVIRGSQLAVTCGETDVHDLDPNTTEPHSSPVGAGSDGEQNEPEPDVPEHPPSNLCPCRAPPRGLELATLLTEHLLASSSAVARAWRSEECSEPGDRRDLFPLPRVESLLLPASLSAEESRILVDCVNLSIAGLNATLACRSFASTRSGGPSGAQKRVLVHVVEQALSMYKRLADSPDLQSPADALEAFEPRSAETAPRLVADCVDLPEIAASCGP